MKPADQISLKSYCFCIKGNPVAKKRPRFSRFGKTYDVQGAEKKRIKRDMLKQMPELRVLKPLEGAIEANLTFHTPIPQSWSRKAQNASNGKPNSKRPDIDNFLKMYFDIMNGLVYKDDGQIASVACRKVYSEDPRVEITVSEIPKGV